MTTLSEFLTSKNIKVTEGNISGINSQRNEICDILKNKNYSYIMEIGFNAGHSAEVFLKNNQYITIYKKNLGLLKKEIEFSPEDSREAAESISIFESPINSPPNCFTRSPDVIAWPIRTN